MKAAILALTCGRVAETELTWAHNFANAGMDFDLYWWDNTQDKDDACDLLNLPSPQPVQTWHATQNEGISIPLNLMMSVAFENGADFICTMANDILEPDNWLKERAEVVRDVPKIGVVAIPPAGLGTRRYERFNLSGWVIESGDVIGNFGISRELYEAIGGFSLDYGLYGPIDLDYCFRARLAGFRTVYISDKKSEHIGVDNPKDYQDAKDKSLAESWSKYHANLKAYQNGSKSIVV